MNEDRRHEIIGILLFAFALLLILSLVSFVPEDLSFYTSSSNHPPQNWVGPFGARVAGSLFFLFGWTAFLIPTILLIWGALKFFGKDRKLLTIRLWGGTVLFLATASLLSLLTFGSDPLRFQAGGLLGLFISDFLKAYLRTPGSFVVLGTIFLICLILATNLRVDPILLSLFRSLQRGLTTFTHFLRRRKGRERKFFESAVKRIPLAGPGEEKEPSVGRVKEERKEKETFPRIVIPKLKLEKITPPQETPRSLLKEGGPKEVGDFQLPSLELLDSPPPSKERPVRENLQENSRILEETLRDFGIEVEVVAVEPGPVITRYELQPAPGVKVNKIKALSDDLALVMKAQSVRIIAPIPGKSAVGIEVPNSSTTFVTLKEVLESEAFRRSRSKLTLALGKDTGGNPLVTDLADMPHLLIAGTTGSGKTVCINAIITSLLFNASPDEVKFLMVDPKMVELALFNDLPHLIAPVVTDPKKVKGALAWVVQEMESRYQRLAKMGVRHIDLYNQRVSEKKELPEGETFEHLPYLIVVIDELADLMMVVPQEVETAITRLAQLSRAVGIHMVLATQRPSVDVLTGIIKANFPARISFKVASKVDSRTVLDMGGADKLVGRGDMLFLRPDLAKPIRAQGALIQDQEIERVAQFIRSQRPPFYHEGVLQEQEKRMGATRAKDELYEDAVRTVLETRHASVSVLQRRFGLGYSRAARLVDMMEEEGIVGPYRGSKPREILVDLPEKHEMLPEEPSKS
ncbi:DNA translocase FtsK [candidate division TA06 bacterium]|nr:DNA translocase FtsK [candidate division TA06 bacterium]